ncbi:MAG TPA: hypothetical protein VMT24_18325, partial [Aggregatilineaceae bacterium]|nr:hypothetical protein [Aggregatilineaceae bacterium]
MQKTLSKQFVLVLAVISLFALFLPTLTLHGPLVHAQEVSYWCTNIDVSVRSCPRWHDCDVRFSYSANTLLFVIGMETGDREAAVDQ